MALVQDSDEGAVLALHVQPKAARTEYVGVHGDTLKFRVAAPPVDGAANEEICRYLAEVLVDLGGLLFGNPPVLDVLAGP